MARTRGPERTFEEVFVERLKQESRAAGPGFAASLALHLVLLTLCAFVVVSRDRRREMPQTITGFNGNLLDLRGPRKKSIAPLQLDSIKIEPGEPAAAAPAAETQAPAEAPTIAVKKPLEVNVAGSLGSRGSARGGGTGSGDGGESGRASGAGDAAVSLGLAWLSRQQKSDGHWELHQGYPDAGQVRTNVGATALALLAFLGTGETHREGKNRDRIGKCLKWLIGAQKKSGPLKGELYDFDREGDAATFYAHGQATIALCEAFAMTGDAELRGPILDALAFIYEAQHPVTGGWKYRRHSEGDLSVFGWQMMAMQSARMAGLEIPADVLDKAAHFLDLVQEEEGARYRYEPNPARSPTPAMTAEGLFCRQYLGWPADHPALQAGVRYLLEPENLPDWSSPRRNVYHWYYAAQVLHNLGGNDWENWNALAREELVKSQAKAGKVGGSWNPFQPTGAADENADKGGRLYVTCLCLLVLETPYRHVPLYGAK